MFVVDYPPRERQLDLVLGEMPQGAWCGPQVWLWVYLGGVGALSCAGRVFME